MHQINIMNTGTMLVVNHKKESECASSLHVDEDLV